MKSKVRAIFWIHATIAGYCVLCGLLDAHGLFRSWLIPHSVVFFALLASAPLLPILAVVALIGSGHKHPVLLMMVHLSMSGCQVMAGLLPLIA